MNAASVCSEHSVQDPNQAILLFWLFLWCHKEPFDLTTWPEPLSAPQLGSSSWNCVFHPTSHHGGSTPRWSRAAMKEGTYKGLNSYSSAKSPLCAAAERGSESTGWSSQLGKPVWTEGSGKGGLDGVHMGLLSQQHKLWCSCFIVREGRRWEQTKSRGRSPQRKAMKVIGQDLWQT